MPDPEQVGYFYAESELLCVMLRVFYSDLPPHQPVIQVVTAVGDGCIATLKGLKADVAFKISHYRAIRNELKRLGYVKARWERYREDGTIDKREFFV